MKWRMIAALSVVALNGCAGTGPATMGEAATAASSTAADSAAVSFAQADLDHDARISPREYSLWRRNFAENAPDARAAAGGTGEDDAFYAADSDLNGVLTLDEWQAMMRAGAPARTPTAASRRSAPAAAPSAR